MLPSRLTWIDETNRSDHPFLREEDSCLFFGDYVGGQSYRGGATNQLVFNYKCPPTTAAVNVGRRGHKERAIATVSSGLRNSMTREDAESVTWVPIPTSKVVGDPDYDDRLIRTLKTAFAGYDADIRALLRQSANTTPDHATEDRTTPEELFDVLEVDHSELIKAPLRSTVILFDDVITTGKHFKCCERRLREVVPADILIVGIFVARRIIKSPFEAGNAAT